MTSPNYIKSTMQKENSGAKYKQITSTEPTPDEVRDEVYRSIRVNDRYVIPWGGQRPSCTSVLRWALIEKNERGIGGGIKKLFKYNKAELDLTLPVTPINQPALESPPCDDIQVTWLGHATVLVQFDGLNILTDPILNSFCGPTKILSKKRYRPVPCSVEELPDIDAVCISHNHFDHLDSTTVLDLNKKCGKTLHWYVPMGLRDWMMRHGSVNVTELEWWEESVYPKQDVGYQEMKFIFVPSQHWSRRGIFDENKSLWGSWCVIGSKKFFFAGDTGYEEQVFKQIGQHYGPFDLSAIPIGAYKPRWFLKFQHVDPSEAVQIHEDVRSKTSLGIHWGTFPLGYEHYMDPPKDLKAALQERGIEDSRFVVLNHGESKTVGSIQ